MLSVPSVVSPSGGPLHGAFASLGYRNYLYLWLAQVTHSGALWLEMVARPLLVLDMTGSAVHLGLVMAVRTVPSMAFGPVAGVVADSFNRRTVMLATKAIVFGFSALFLLLMVADWLELWHVYLFTFLRGATMAFDQPARRAIIPSMVPRHLVTNAMALSSGSVQVMRIGGTAGAGLLIAFWDIPAAFAAISVCYAAAVVLTWQLRTPDHERRGYQGFGAFGTDLLEGLRMPGATP